MPERVIDNLLVRIHFIIVMVRWTGLAPWQFESLFPGSLTSTFLTRTLTFIHTEAVLCSNVDEFVPETRHVNLRIVGQRKRGRVASRTLSLAFAYIYLPNLASGGGQDAGDSGGCARR